MENLPNLKSVPKRLELFKEQDEQELPVEADQAPPIQVSAIKSEPVITAADDPVTKIYLEQCLNKVAELGNSERFRKHQTNPTETSTKSTVTKVVHPGAYIHPGRKLRIKCQLTEKLLILEQTKPDSHVNIQKEMLDAATKCGCYKEVASVFLEDKPLPLVKDAKTEEIRFPKSEPGLEGSNNQSEKTENEANKISIPISYLTFSFMVLLQQCFDLQFTGSGSTKESECWMRIKNLLKSLSELKSSNLRDLRYYLRLYSSGNINQESEYEKHLLTNHPTLHETLITNTRHVVDGTDAVPLEDSTQLASIEEDAGEDPSGDAEENNKKSKKTRSQGSNSKKNSSANSSKPTKKSSAKTSIFADDSEGDGASKRYYLGKMMLVGHQPEALIESCVLLLLPAFIESKKMILIYGNDTDFPELDLVVRRTLSECLPKLEVKFINHDAVNPTGGKIKEDSEGPSLTDAVTEGDSETTPKESSGDQFFVVEFFSAKSLRSRNGLNLKTGPSGLLLHRTAATTMKDSARCREIMAQAYRTIASDLKVYRPKLSESCRRGKTNALVPFAFDLDDLWCHLLSYSITLDLARMHEYESSTSATKRSFAKVYKVDSDRRTDFERLERFISAHLLDEDTAEQGLENIPAHLHRVLASEQSRNIKNVLVWRFDTSSPEQDKANVSLEIDKLHKMVHNLNTAGKEASSSRNFELVDLSNQKGYQADQKAQQFLINGVSYQTYSTTRIYLLHGKFIPLMLYDLEFSMMVCLGNATYLADFRNFLRHAYQTKPNISLLLFHASKSDNFFEKPLITSTFLKGGSLDTAAQGLGAEMPVELGETHKVSSLSVLKVEDCLATNPDNQGLISLRATVPEKPAVQTTVQLKEIADFVGIHSAILVPANARLSQWYRSNEAYKTRFAEFLPTTPEPAAGQGVATDTAPETPISRQPAGSTKSSRQKAAAQAGKKDAESGKPTNSKIVAELPDEGQDSVFLSGGEEKDAERSEKTEAGESSAPKKTKKKKNRDKEQASDSNPEEKKKDGKKKVAEMAELQSPSEDSSIEPKQKTKKKSKKVQKQPVSPTLNNSDESSPESSQKKKDKKKSKKLKKKKRQAKSDDESQPDAEKSASDHEESDPEKFLKKRKMPSPSKKPEAKSAPTYKREKEHSRASPRPSRNFMIQTPNSGSNSTDGMFGAQNQKNSEEMEYYKEESESEGYSEPEELDNVGQQIPVVPFNHQVQPLCLEIDETNEAITMALESRENLLEKLKNLARRTQIPSVLELALKKTRESGPTLRIPFLKCSAHFLGFLRDHFELKPAKMMQRPLWEAIMHLIPHQGAKMDIWDPAIKRVHVPAPLEQNIAALASNMLPKALVYADQPEILMGACLLSAIPTLRETGNLVIICGEKSSLHEWLSVLRIAFQPECFMNDAQYAQSQMGVSKKLPKIELISLEHCGLDGLNMRSKEENTLRQRPMDPLKKLDDSHLKEVWKIYVTISSTQKDWEVTNFNILSHAVIFYKTDKNMPEGGVVSHICMRAKKMVFAQPVKHFISAKLGLYPNKLQAMYPHLANLSTSMQILTQSLLSIRLAKLFNVKGALHEVKIYSLEQVIYMPHHDMRRGKPGHHPASSSSRQEPFAITAIFDLLEYFIIKNQFERVAIWSFTPQEKEANKVAVDRFLRENKPQGNWEILDCYQPNLHPRARDTVTNKKLRHIIFLGGPDPADLPVYSIPFDLFVFVNPPKFTESFKAYIRCLSLIKQLQVVFLGQCHYSAFRFSNQNGKWNDANPDQVVHIQDQYFKGISRDPATSILKLTGTVRVPTYQGPVRIWEWPDREPESVVITNQNSGGMRDPMMYRATDYQMNYSQTFARNATYQPPYMQQIRGMSRGRGRPRGSRASNRPVMDTGYPSHMGMSRPPPGYTYPTAAYSQSMAYASNVYGPRGGMPAYSSRGMPGMPYGHMMHPSQMPQARGGHMPGYPGFAMPMYGPNTGMPASSSSYQMMGHDPQRGGFMRGARGGSTGNEGFYSKPYPMGNTPSQPTSKAADEEVFVEEIEGADNEGNQNTGEQNWEAPSNSSQMQYSSGALPQKNVVYPGFYQGQAPGGYGSIPNAYASSSFAQTQQMNNHVADEAQRNPTESVFTEQSSTTDQNQPSQMVADASLGETINQSAIQNAEATAN